jgi:diguanylate cyclase (GGDEF)-like protein
MKNLGNLIGGRGAAAMLDHIHAMVALLEKDGGLLAYNRAFEDFKTSLPDINTLEDFFLDKKDFQNRVRSGKRERWVAELVHSKDGQTVHCDCLITPLKNDQLLFVAEHLQADFTLAKKIQSLSNQVEMYKKDNDTAKYLMRRKQIDLDGVMAQAQEVMKIDPLTFLPNRRLIIRELQDEVLRAQRYSTPLSISVVDIDHFKRINDTYGHVSGDEVLRHVGYQLRDSIRHPDMSGRYGGEEFLIILPNSDSSAAVEQASRLCRKVRETEVHINGHTVQVTISIGIAEFRVGVDTWESFLNRADTAMYEAKRAGRDRWMVAEET